MKMKGLSPIIAGVLLVALTVGIAAIVINWASSYTRSQINTVAQNTKTNCAFVSAQFTEDPSVSSNSASSNVTLKLLNTGSYPLTSGKQTVIWTDGTVTVFTANFTVDTDTYKEVVLNNNTDCDTNSYCGSFASKTIKKVYVAIEDCEGSYVEW